MTDAFAAEVWADVVPLLVAQKTIATIDNYAVAMLCQSYSVWRRSSELAEIADAGTIEWQRLRSAANASMTQVLRLSQRFGLTPSDRVGLATGGPDEKKDTGKARFFQRSG